MTVAYKNHICMCIELNIYTATSLHASLAGSTTQAPMTKRAKVIAGSTSIAWFQDFHL